MPNLTSSGQPLLNARERAFKSAVGLTKGNISSASFFPAIGAFLRAAIADGAAAEVPAATTGAAAIAEALVGGVLAILSLPEWLTALIVVVALSAIFQGVLRAAGHVPLLGSRFQGALQAAFGWIDNLAGWVAHGVANAVTDVMHAVQTTFRAMLGINADAAIHNTTRTIVHNTIEPATASIARLQTEIDHLKAAVAWLQWDVQQPVRTAPGTISTTGAIHDIQQKWLQLSGEVTALKGDVVRAEDVATQALNKVEQLTQQLHAVRAVEASWSEMQHELENLGSLTTTFIDETAGQLAAQQRNITRLLPLALLLAPGIAGLRNLRQLEDTPCMCPQLPHIPNELGTALALYEFVTNG